jgi:glycosyltransferase involved in cell wall biosynthesis
VSKPWTIVQLIPALNAGGAERSTLEIASALAERGHRSIVVSSGGAWVKRLTDAGSTHRILPMDRKSPAALRHVFGLRRILREYAPDLVHARSRLPAWLALGALTAMRPRPHFVTTVHGLNSVNAYSAVMTRGERVIAVSATTRAHLARHYPRLDPERIRVIPRGVDRAQFAPGQGVDPAWREAFLTEFPQLRGGRWLTLPGRGTRLKGHLDAMTLVARLALAGTDARLLLPGVIEPGREDYLEELRAHARSLGVGERVVCTPSRADIREIYLASDLVLQLSTRPESFGRVVAEALSLGRPVLGYAHGGVGELLERHYPAGASRVGSIDALVERALVLLSDPPAVDTDTIPRLADLQRLTLSVYAELIDGAPVDPAFVTSSP